MPSEPLQLNPCPDCGARAQGQYTDSRLRIFKCGSRFAPAPECKAVPHQSMDALRQRVEQLEAGLQAVLDWHDYSQSVEDMHDADISLEKLESAMGKARQALSPH